ncbi:pentapeptide repeat-containing protein [Nocardiopsis sp. NPDC006832]|uniref:pentapeptide repeat-containing protein n=1 Tax=Nocardiopsis sp. NPDC006832 TaxID=3157188 RepID=UPI0033E4CEB4
MPIPRPVKGAQESEPDHTWEGRPPRLWLHIAVTWTVTALCVGVLILGALWFLGFPEIARPDTLSLRAFEGVVIRAFAIMAGLSGIALLVIAYHRQRNNNLENLRALRAAERDGVKLFNDRFTGAYTELGNEQAAARLGAVHALAHLADDAPTPELRQMCINVLCSYLRMPHAPVPEGDEVGTAARQEYEAFREVRFSIIRVIGDRLRDEHSSWQGHRFDLSNVVFDGGSLRGVHLIGGKLIFDRSVFGEGEMDFRYSRVSGARVTFRGARFTGGTVNFRHVRFEGPLTDFHKAEFSGARVLLHNTRIAPETMTFTRAGFTGGRVEFRSEGEGGEPALGDPPNGLLDAVAAGAPGVVRLPEPWTGPTAGRPTGSQGPAAGEDASLHAR